jgi:hypothetical protein
MSNVMERLVTDKQVRQFERDGFLVARGLFSTEEADWDVLKHYPRIMHPHRFDERSQRYMLDDADAENGTLFVVPGSHREPVLCPHAADLSKSFTTEEVDVPCGTEEWEAFKQGILEQNVYDEKSLDWLLATAKA